MNPNDTNNQDNNNNQVPPTPPPFQPTPTQPQPQTQNPYQVPYDSINNKKSTFAGRFVKNFTSILALLIILTVVTFGGRILLGYLGVDTTKVSTTVPSSPEDEAKLREKNAETVKYMNEFDTVCETGSVKNASDYKKPYVVAAFSEKIYGYTNYGDTTIYDKSYSPKSSDDISSVNVVACLKMNKDNAVKSKTCDMKINGNVVAVDYFSTEYSLSFHEAKSGKKITDGGTVNGPANNCPFLASLDDKDPKLFASPNKDALDVEISKFVSAN